ncbi:helix-turn-helix transcriptional regulator [Streptomyces sp. NPDC006367]|uniref:helix-turn-helix domain-containing protein n=1 Tax=unclassified Streptomyces TaxID=2593676 RepID=UPI0033A1D8F5
MTGNTVRRTVVHSDGAPGMPGPASAAVPCEPDCDAPSLPPVLVGALMRHYRTRAGLSLRKAGTVVHASPSQIGALEKAQRALSDTSVRALLDAYDTPVHEIQQALTLLAHPEHQHRIDFFTASPAWGDALTAGSHSLHVYSASPASLSLFSSASSPAPGAPGRSLAAPGRCRVVLLLHESLLDLARAGHPALPHLVRLAESRTISMHLVPDQLAAPGPLLAEYTYTAWGWDGSAAERLRRQLFVTHPHDGAPGSVCNGPAAVAERQLLQQAVRAARPLQWSLLRLRQAARAQQQVTPADAPHARPGRPVHAPVFGSGPAFPRNGPRELAQESPSRPTSDVEHTPSAFRPA